MARGVNEVGRTAMRSGLARAAGERRSDPSDSATVRCRGCRTVIPIRMATDMEPQLRRHDTRAQSGSVWICGACLARVRGDRA